MGGQQVDMEPRGGEHAGQVKGVVCVRKRPKGGGGGEALTLLHRCVAGGKKLLTWTRDSKRRNQFTKHFIKPHAGVLPPFSLFPCNALPLRRHANTRSEKNEGQKNAHQVEATGPAASSTSSPIPYHDPTHTCPTQAAIIMSPTHTHPTEKGKEGGAHAHHHHRKSCLGGWGGWGGRLPVCPLSFYP